jgi:hypothetical protein
LNSINFHNDETLANSIKQKQPSKSKTKEGKKKEPKRQRTHVPFNFHNDETLANFIKQLNPAKQREGKKEGTKREPSLCSVYYYYYYYYWFYVFYLLFIFVVLFSSKGIITLFFGISRQIGKFWEI